MRVPYQSRLTSYANMTPMIDVVFLLIIFFLVASHLARQEHRLPLDLPLATSHLPLNPEKSSLTISVDLSSKIHVAGEVVEIGSLSGVLRQYLDKEQGEASIRIRTDGAVQYRFIEPILSEVAKLGIGDTAIAVQEGNSL